MNASAAALRAHMRGPGRMRFSAVIAAVAAAALVLAFVQFGSKAHSATPHRATTDFAKKYTAAVTDLANQTRSLQIKAQGVSAPTTDSLLAVYRQLDVLATDALTQIKKLTPDPQSAQAFNSFVASLGKYEQDLRSVIYAGDANDANGLRNALQAFQADTTALASARADLEATLIR